MSPTPKEVELSVSLQSVQKERKKETKDFEEAQKKFGKLLLAVLDRRVPKLARTLGCTSSSISFVGIIFEDSGQFPCTHPVLECGDMYVLGGKNFANSFSVSIEPDQLKVQWKAGERKSYSFLLKSDSYGPTEILGRDIFWRPELEKRSGLER